MQYAPKQKYWAKSLQDPWTTRMERLLYPSGRSQWSEHAGAPAVLPQEGLFHGLSPHKAVTLLHIQDMTKMPLATTPILPY